MTASLYRSRWTNCEHPVRFNPSSAAWSSAKILVRLLNCASLLMSQMASPGILHSNRCFRIGPPISLPGSEISAITVAPWS